MSIEIKITGDDAAMIAQNVLTLAFMFAPHLRGAGEPRTGPQTVEAEPVAQTKAPRATRQRKAETIEHDPKEVKQDVHGVPNVAGDADANAGGDRDSAASGDVADARSEASAQASGAVGAANEASAKVDAVAEAADDPAPEASEPSMTIDELRKYTLSAYLMKHVNGLDAQKAEFNKMLEAFEVAKIADLPDSKINAFKALVDQKIAKAEAAA